MSIFSNGYGSGFEGGSFPASWSVCSKFLKSSQALAILFVCFIDIFLIILLLSVFVSLFTGTIPYVFNKVVV